MQHRKGKRTLRPWEGAIAGSGNSDTESRQVLSCDPHFDSNELLAILAADDCCSVNHCKDSGGDGCQNNISITSPHAQDVGSLRILPREMRSYIFSFLDAKAITAFASCSKTALANIGADLLARSLPAEQFELLPNRLIRILFELQPVAYFNYVSTLGKNSQLGKRVLNLIFNYVIIHSLPGPLPTPPDCVWILSIVPLAMDAALASNDIDLLIKVIMKDSGSHLNDKLFPILYSRLPRYRYAYYYNKCREPANEDAVLLALGMNPELSDKNRIALYNYLFRHDRADLIATVFDTELPTLVSFSVIKALIPSAMENGRLDLCQHAIALLFKTPTLDKIDRVNLTAECKLQLLRCALGMPSMINNQWPKLFDYLQADPDCLNAVDFKKYQTIVQLSIKHMQCSKKPKSILEGLERFTSYFGDPATSST